MKLRVIDAGDVPYYQSQTLYHAAAYCLGEEDDNALTICSPRETYVSVGYFQDVEKEVDLDYCRSNNIPVIRRECGGGAVLLDNNQLFFHFIFHKKDAPARVVDIYKKFLRLPILAYQKMGIEAFHKPVNDICVGQQKIGGTAAAEIGNGLVTVGSFMLDFNHELMSRVLKVPDEKFRDKVLQNIKGYIATIRQLTDPVPSREEVKKIFLDVIREELGAEIVFSEINAREKSEMEKLDKRFLSEEWLYYWKSGRTLPTRVKIQDGVNVVEVMHKSPGGLIRIMAELIDGVFRDVSISGDFVFLRDDTGELENTLKGLPLDGTVLQEKISGFYENKGLDVPGTGPEDWVEALMKIPAALKD